MAVEKLSNTARQSRTTRGRRALLARTIVFPGESRNRFIALLSELEEQLRPADCIETYLVERMAVARWRELRAWATEAELFITGVDQSPAAVALRSLVEAEYDHQYTRALAELRKYRKKQKFAKQTQLTPIESTN